MRSRMESIRARLADERSGKVAFISHCLLNENVRYLGGAFHPAAVDDVVDTLRSASVGLCQMPCPEQRAWGGVLKRNVVRWYARPNMPKWLRLAGSRAFLVYTRLRYRVLARSVAREIADYTRSGFDVVAVYGIGGSPSCGVFSTLDLNGALRAAMSCPLARLDRRYMNEDVVAASVVSGRGLFVTELQRQLSRSGIIVPWREHDLIREMRTGLAG